MFTPSLRYYYLSGGWTTSGSSISRTLNDTLSTSDTTLRTQARTINGTLSASDTLLRTQARTINGTLSASDTLLASRTRTQNDTLAASDTLLRTQARTINGTLSASDTLLSSRTRTQNDTLALADNVQDAKAFYFDQALTSGAGYLNMIEDGPAPTFGRFSPDTAWRVRGTSANVAVGESAQITAQTVTSLANFTATTTNKPGVPTTSNGFRTATAKTGTFNAGTWTIALRAICVTGAIDGSFRFRVRVFRSANANGSSAVELTSSVLLTGGTGSLTLGQQVTVSTLWSAPLFVVNNEYLFVTVAAECTNSTTAGGPSDLALMGQEGVGVFSAVYREGVLSGQALSQTMTDSPTIADAYAKTQAFARTPNDTLATSDATTRSRVRLLSDSLSASDAISRVQGHIRTFNDTEALSDALLRARARVINGTLSLADSASTSFAGIAISRTVRDAMAIYPGDEFYPGEGTLPLGGITDAYTTGQAFIRTQNDTEALADALSLRARTRTILDPIGIYTGSIPIGEDVFPLAGITDQYSANLIQLISRTLTDTLATSDAQSARSRTRTLLDTEALADAYAKVQTFSRSTNDALALADILLLRSRLRLLSNSVSTADSYTPSSGNVIQRTVSDALTLADAHTRIRTRALLEAVSIADTLAKTRQVYLTYGDVLTIADYLLGVPEPPEEPEEFTVPDYRILDIPGRFERRFMNAQARHPNFDSRRAGGRIFRIPRRTQ